MRSITVQAGKGYEVLIGSALLPELGQRFRACLPKAERAVVVTDEHVGAIYGDAAEAALTAAGVRVRVFSFPAGERSKNSETYIRLLEYLAEGGMSRSDGLVALGGGVVGDLTGFAAATYQRGMPYIQVPTSLLAMVDSSVGGKTAIDLKSGKNLAGAFYQPALVLCDTDTLGTLPEDEMTNGVAEVIKYGMLGNAELLEKLQRQKLRAQLEDVIEICVSMKRDIVQRDEFDQGERQLLNFGHTFGHAIEGLSAYQIPHGRAVSMGMHLVTRGAAAMGLCPGACLTVLKELLKRYELPMETKYPPEALYEGALGDKKRTGGRIHLVIPVAVGRCKLHEMPVEDLLHWARGGPEK